MKNKLLEFSILMKSISYCGKTIHLHVVALICSMKMMWMFQCFSHRFFIDFHIFSCLCWGSILESIFARIFDGKRHQNDLQNPSPSRPLQQKWLQNGITPNSRSIPEPNFFRALIFQFPLAPFWLTFGALWLTFGALGITFAHPCAQCSRFRGFLTSCLIFFGIFDGYLM